MNKIQKTSRYIGHLLNIMLMLIPIFILAQWFLLSFNDPNNFGIVNTILSYAKGIQTPSGYVSLQNITWTPSSLLIGVISDFIQIIPFTIGICILKKIFKAYQAGNIFTLTNAIAYKKLGFLFLADAFIASPLGESLMLLATTLNNGVGHRILSIGFGTPNLSQIFYGTIVIMVSWVMQEACKINAEQELTI